MEKKKEQRSITLEPVSGPVADILKKHLSAFVEGYVRVQPGGMVMPCHYKDWYQKYEEFPIRKDDIWVVSYPKAGTTWTQEIVWCIMFDMKSEEAKHELMRRFPFFEFDALITGDFNPPDLPADSPMRIGNSYKTAMNMKSPRTIKSHFSTTLLPPAIWDVKPKLIYVTRDPRDVCISYYYHCIKLEGYSGTFDQFVKIFLGDMITYSPIWRHMIEFWERRNEENILFIRYEELKEDLPGMVRKISKFLGKTLTEEDVANITDHCTFGTMRKNKAANNETFVSADGEEAQKLKFMRKGIVGDWKNHLTKEHIEAFKEWTLRNVKDSEFPFYRDYD